jgi:signal transduction histidine kinase
MSATTEDPIVEVRSGEELYQSPYDEELPVQRGSRLPSLPALSPTPTYIGIAVAAVGFGLIFYAWSKVAGIADNVALQMPYLVSGGLAGLGLVMVGVTIINVAAKRRDARMRQQQTELLADALHELRTALDDGSL